MNRYPSRRGGAPSGPGRTEPGADIGGDDVSIAAVPGVRFAKLLVFCLPTLAAFGPFIPGFASLFGFRLAALLLLLVVFVGKREKRPSTMRQLTILLFFVWVLAAVIALVINGPAAQSWSELLSLGTGLAILLAIALCPSPKELLIALLRGWVLAYVVVSAFAVVELTTGVSMSSSAVVERTLDGWAVTVSFFNPNNYATFLLYSFIALLVFLAQAKTLFTRLFALALLASLPVFMSATNSRTGVWVLAGLVAVSILMFLKGRVVFRLALVLATLVVTLVLLENMEQTPFQELASYLGNSGYTIDVLGAALPVDSSTYVRWQLTLAGGALTAAFPLFGGGPGAFESYMANSGRDAQTLGIMSPHNGFMEVLSQYGIFVFLILLIWFARMLWLGANARKSDDRLVTGGGTALILGILPLPVILTMHSSAIEPSTTWLFFAFLLLLARNTEIALSSGAPELGAADNADLRATSGAFSPSRRSVDPRLHGRAP